MTLIAQTLNEIPIGGPYGAQVCLRITPPRSGYVIADRCQMLVNNPDTKGPGAYCNGFRNKPLHYLCMSPNIDPASAYYGVTTLDDPNAVTIHNNGVFPLTTFRALRVTKGSPFYSVWVNDTDEPDLNWVSLDFLQGDPAQCPDIQFQWRWKGADGILTPWGAVSAAGTPMSILPSPYNYYFADGVTCGYNGVEVVLGVVVDGAQYGFRAYSRLRMAEPNATTSRRRFSTLEQRIQWLLKNRIHLIGALDLKKTVTHMQADGLVSKLTNWPDCKTGIEEAVRQAKFRWYAEHNGREVHP